MKRPEKEAVVAQLTDKFRNADAIYLTEYRGLTVPQISELREKLGRDTSYTVAKNTLVRIAAKEAGIEGLDELLAGPTAVTCSMLCRPRPCVRSMRCARSRKRLPDFAAARRMNEATTKKKNNCFR